MDTGELLRTRTDLAVGILVGVGVLVLGRVLLGVVTGDTIDWETWVGIASGLAGSVAMVGVLRLLADVDDDERPLFRRLQFVHVLYGVGAGAAYPAIVSLAGLASTWARAFPEAFLGGLALAVGMYALAVAVYVPAGAMHADPDRLRAWLVVLGLYLVYGVVYGTSMSLTRRVWFPVFA